MDAKNTARFETYFFEWYKKYATFHFDFFLRAVTCLIHMRKKNQTSTLHVK